MRGVVLFVALLAVPTVSAVILGSGDIQISVAHEGGQVLCEMEPGPGGPSKHHCSVPSDSTSKRFLGLRHVPTAAEGGDIRSYGHVYDNWGLAARETGGAFKVACMSIQDMSFRQAMCFRAGPGDNAIASRGALTTGAGAVPSDGVVVDLFETIQIRTEWGPTSDARLMQGKITFTNAGTTPYDSLLYRRWFSLNAAADSVANILTIAGAPPQLTATMTGAPESTNPLYALLPFPLAGSRPEDVCPPGPVYGPVHDRLPGNWVVQCQGATIDFDLGGLAPGASKSFTMLVGAAADETSALASLDAADADIYVLSQRTVNSPDGASDLTFMWAFSGLRLPEPGFSWNPSIPCAGRAVTFVDLSRSAIDIGRGTWDFGDGSGAAYSGNATHTYASPGTYTVTLELTNINGWSAAVSHDVTVIDCVPQAAFTCTTDMDDYRDVHLMEFATGTNASILSWRWDLGDGTTRSGRSFTHTYPTEGWYTVTLTVTDEYGITGTATRQCYAHENLPPRIDAILDLTVYVGTSLEVRPTATDPDGDALTFAVIGAPSGSTFDGATLHWRPAIEHLGTHGPIMVTVSDGEFTDSTTFLITVLEPGPGGVPGSADADSDGHPDSSDACPAEGLCAPAPRDQVGGEAVGVRLGSRPPIDTDQDGLVDGLDNCRLIVNSDQADFDDDGIGDACDDDADGDRVLDMEGPRRHDNCPWLYNPLQEDEDRDGIGDACEGDRDSDGVPDFDALGQPLDNCVWTPNPEQEDLDGDGRGDVCGPGDGPAAPRVGAALAVPPPGDGPSVLWAMLPLALVVALTRRWWIRLFTRLPRDAISGHPIRAQILDVVQSEPGIHMADVMRRVERSKGVVSHHVRILEQHGLLVRRRDGKYTCLLPAAATQRPPMVLSTELARDVLAAITAHPGLTVNDLVKQVGAKRTAVEYHLARFRRRGLVRAAKEPGGIRLHPA